MLQHFSLLCRTSKFCILWPTVYHIYLSVVFVCSRVVLCSHRPVDLATTIWFHFWLVFVQFKQLYKLMKLKTYLVERGVLINNIHFEKKKYHNNVYMLLSWVYTLKPGFTLIYIFIRRNFELPPSKCLYLCCMFEHVAWLFK